MKTARLVFPIIIALCLASPAYAVSEFAGSTFPEQVVQEITATEQYAKQATQLATQLQQLENQVINMENIGSGAWSTAQSKLDQIAQTVAAAKNISYAAQNTLSQMESAGNPQTASLAQLSQNLGNWRTNYLNQVKQYLQLSGLNPNGFQTLSQALQSITQAGNSAAGRKAVLQAGNQLAAFNAQQLQQLNQQLHTAHALQIEHQQMVEKQTQAANAKAAEQGQNWTMHGNNPIPSLNQSSGGATQTILPVQSPAQLGLFVTN